MFLRIDSASAVPITRQILDQIRAGVVSGGLRPGDRLPSVRALARELAVNQNTVLRVYERLEAAGLIERRHGDGTYVTGAQAATRLAAERDRLRREAEGLVRQASALGLGVDEVEQIIREAWDGVTQEPDSPM